MTALPPSKSRPPHRRGTSPWLFLALAAFLTFLPTTVAYITCISPSGTAKVGDDIYFELGYDSYHPIVLEVKTIDATIFCNDGTNLVMIPNIDNGAGYTITASILSRCSSGQVYVRYDGTCSYFSARGVKDGLYRVTCPFLTIQVNVPTTGQPSSSLLASPSSTAAPTTITTALLSTSLVTSLSTRAPTTATAAPSPNAVSSTITSPIATGNAEDQTNKSSGPKNTTVVAIGAVAGIAALAFLAFGLVTARRRQQRNRRRLSSLGDGYPMKHRSDDGYGDDGYGFGTSGRGYVHSGMMSETTGQFGYGDYGRDVSHSNGNYNNNNNNVHNYDHNTTSDTYGYNYGDATPAAYYPYHDPMVAANVAVAGAGAGAGYAGNGASDLNEYMPPPPALIPTAATSRLPARPELSYKEEYSSSAWDQRPTVIDAAPPTATATATSTATTGDAGAGATATHRFDRYGLDAYSCDDEDPYGGQANDNRSASPHESLQYLSASTNHDGSMSDQDYVHRLRQSVASTAAAAAEGAEGANRDSAIDADIGLSGFSFPPPPATSVAEGSSILAKTKTPEI